MHSRELSRRSFMKASAGAVAAVGTGRAAATPPSLSKTPSSRIGPRLFFLWENYALSFLQFELETVSSSAHKVHDPSVSVIIDNHCKDH